MNKREYLLVCMAEECAEIQKEIAKALRFGENDIDPNSRSSLQNMQKITSELVDLLAVADMLAKDGNFAPPYGFPIDREQKIQRVLKWMEYSRERGCLTDTTDSKGG